MPRHGCGSCSDRIELHGLSHVTIVPRGVYCDGESSRVTVAVVGGVARSAMASGIGGIVAVMGGVGGCGVVAVCRVVGHRGRAVLPAARFICATGDGTQHDGRKYQQGQMSRHRDHGLTLNCLPAMVASWRKRLYQPGGAGGVSRGTLPPGRDVPKGFLMMTIYLLFLGCWLLTL